MSTDERLFDTAPPEEPVQSSVLGTWKRRIVGKASAAIMPIVKRAAGPYMGGESIEDAMSVAVRLAGERFETTLGYWDTGRESGRHVADVDVNAIQRLSERDLRSYMSVKPPALRFSKEIAGELAGAAASWNVRVHFDSHGTDVADLSNDMLQVMIDTLGGPALGTTLPGRWRRSLRDADWAIEHGLNVRVVKGQWPDPEDPKRDIAGGFLEVIDHLAGRARHVAVATHDFALGSEAIRRLRAAGTSCEIEVLLGMPAKPLLRWAKENGVKVRIYVPFGGGFIPNAIGVLRRNPRLVYAVAKAHVQSIGEFLGRALPSH